MRIAFLGEFVPQPQPYLSVAGITWSTSGDEGVFVCTLSRSGNRSIRVKYTMVGVTSSVNSDLASDFSEPFLARFAALILFACVGVKAAPGINPPAGCP